jgi:Ca2+-binding RTX toxin-like protein
VTETHIYSSIEGFADFLSTDFQGFFELTHLEVISDFFTLLDTSTLVPTALGASLIELADGYGRTVRFEGTNFGPITSIEDLTAAFDSLANAVGTLNGSGTGTLSRLILKDGVTEIARLEIAPDAWTLSSGVDAVRIEANLPNSLSQIYAMLDEIFDTSTGEVDPNYNPATSIMAGYNINSIIAASAGIERARLTWTSTGITATTGDYEFSFTGNLPVTFAEIAGIGVALATEAAATGFTLGAGTLINTLTDEVAASIDFGGVDFATLNDSFPFGSAGNDILVSDVVIATSILGGDGDDFFQTLSNPDFYPFDFVYENNSWIDGGAGNDTASYANNPVGLTFISVDHFYWPIPIDEFIVSENDSRSLFVEFNVKDVETFIGTSHDDKYYARYLSDSFDGGNGIDHVYLREFRSEFTLSRDNKGNIIGYSAGSSVPLLSKDVYRNVEWFHFNDFSISAQDIPMRGGPENDHLIGWSGYDFISGEAGNDTLEGGEGNDLLNGGAGNDSTDGGSGNDTIVAGGGSDTLSGGAGDDLIDFAGIPGVSLPSGLSLPLDLNAGPGTSIDAGSGNDILFLQGSFDGKLVGGEGNDLMIAVGLLDLSDADVAGIEVLKINMGTVKARASTFESFDLIVSDFLSIHYPATLALADIGGTTSLDLSDEINPGGPSLRIFGSSDNEEIVTGSQRDIITSGAGNDTLRGGAGRDSLLGEDDDDAIFGGDQNDVTDGGSGNDSLSGDTGDDIAFGGSGNDSVNGGDGNDTVNGDGDNDTINGGSQNDMINGGLGNDVLNGDLGNDFINGNQDNDTLDGGDGNDVLNGGDGNDSINGGNGHETIDGGDGNDTIFGGVGQDQIDGGIGRDRMTGGANNDFYTVDDADDVIIELANEGFDVVNTTLGVYTLPANVERVNYLGLGTFVGVGNSGDNRFTGGALTDRFVDTAGGNDTISGGNGSDSMDFRGATTGVVLNFITNVHGGAAAGDVYSSIEKYFGSNTADDSMTGGGTGRFIFTGGGGNDTLVGAGNIDNLQGQAGDDSISGLAGVDYLDGGAGNDTMTGGLGVKDYFIYSAAGFGQDVVTDFEDNLDKLKVHSGVATSIAAFSITGNGSTNVVLTQISSPTNTITLQSASAINITAADFLFY